ncbi:MAG: redoxin domain-containing protein, partial [Acidimicrobiales bacterium]|nr:redoxin domain-containing protein [Acidimicrobiales bacterium]
CNLRDIAGEIGDTQILGVSPDKPEKQAKFDDKYSLGFPLLADEDHAVAEKYGVWGEKKNYGRTYMGIIRSAFLIDEKGKIAEAWYKISPKDTPLKLKAALDEA